MNQIHEKTVGYQGVLMSVREAGVRRLYSLPSGVRCQPSPGGRGGVRCPKEGMRKTPRTQDSKEG